MRYFEVMYFKVYSLGSSTHLVCVPEPNQPQHGSLSVSRVILQAIHALD